jgi:c-di-GMP-binding flagellar brake protein YcgR
MFQDTRPAALDTTGAADPWAPFSVGQPQERLRLLRSLRDGSVPVLLNAPDGAALTTTVWTIDSAQERLNLSTDPRLPQLARVVESNEAVAVAYLDSVKLQFELHGFVLVHGAQASTLQCRLPAAIYRFQRRDAYRVRPHGRDDPLARFRHPSLPEMALALRVLDLSIGGCALWLPHDVPALQAGTLIGGLVLELDAETRPTVAATLRHVSAVGPGAHGVRIGCEWQALTGSAERSLQRWIDQTQKRRRLLTQA